METPIDICCEVKGTGDGNEVIWKVSGNSYVCHLTQLK